MGTNSRDDPSPIAPPRIHVHKQDDFTVMTSILKEGEDARDYKDGLPQKDTVEYELGSGPPVNEKIPNLIIKIEALRKHYKPRPIFANPTASKIPNFINVEVLCQR